MLIKIQIEDTLAYFCYISFKEFYNAIVYQTTKKELKTFVPRTWYTKKTFGYRVVHHECLLMSYPGHFQQKLFVFFFT